MQVLKNEVVQYFGVSIYNPTSSIIPSVDEIVRYDKDGKPYTQLIRYLAGAPSIFVDKIEDAKKTTKIVIRNGFLNVNSFELQLLEYLDICNYNISNPLRNVTKSGLFKKNNPVADAKVFIDNDYSEARARIRIVEAGPATLQNVAYALGKDHVSKTLTESLRRDLLIYCKQMHVLINELLDDSFSTSVKAMIKRASEEGVIIITADSVLWNTGQGIISPGYGKDMVLEMYHFLTSENGKKVYESLKKAVDPFMDEVQKENFVKVENKNKAVTDPESNIEVSESKEAELYKKAFELGILSIDSSNAIVMSNKPKNIPLGTTTEEVLSLLSSDPSILAKLEEKVKKVG